MRKRWTLTLLVLLAVSSAASAVEWEEIGWTATFVSDHDTGLPAIVFNTGLAYDAPPETMRLRITWEVFSVSAGSETILYEYSRTTRQRDGTERIYSASQAVLTDPGTQYGARVWIDDVDNGLSYHRSYVYLAPWSMRVGLRLVAWDGSEEADLTGLEDDELQQLVSLRRALNSYTVVAEDVKLTSLFSQYAATAEAYPVSVALLPEIGIDGNWGTESQPIIVTFGLAVQLYIVPSSSAAAGFLQQLQWYDQTFVGTVYARNDASAPGQGATVFVHDGMRVILDAALEEEAARAD